MQKSGNEAPEVIQKIVDTGTETKAQLGFGLSKALLQAAEEALISRQPNRHGPKLTRDLVQILH
jgi:hypothetical protein